jgi:L,D-transpeptidase ErfK/SrfK
MIGKLQWVQTLPGENFHTIGRRYGVGYHEIVEANPGLDSEALEPGTPIVLPTYFVLPPGPRKGIVINLAELRLYYYGKGSVLTYPIGIGRANWDTPLGKSYILAKLKDPIWHVPKSIQEASKKEGPILPDRVSPGEDNPLGPYALRLHYYNYLIHGTNEIEGVGRRSTAGCIRMFPEDIKELFDTVSKGTQVNIINEPYKIGWDGQKHLYLEAHLPLKVTDVDSPIVQNQMAQRVSQAVGHK